MGRLARRQDRHGRRRRAAGLRRGDAGAGARCSTSATRSRSRAIPPVSLLPIFPAFYIFDQIDEQISEFLEVSYLWYLPVLAWPTALFMIFATVVLIALIRWLVLPQGPHRHLLDVQRLLHAQMDRGARDRGDARDADLALRHGLHARLVPHHGRDDRQGRRDLDEPRRPLRPHRDRRQELHRRRGGVRRRGRAPRLDAPRDRSRPRTASSSATTPSCRPAR